MAESKKIKSASEVAALIYGAMLVITTQFKEYFKYDGQKKEEKEVREVMNLIGVLLEKVKETIQSFSDENASDDKGIVEVMNAIRLAAPDYLKEPDLIPKFRLSIFEILLKSKKLQKISFRDATFVLKGISGSMDNWDYTRRLILSKVFLKDASETEKEDLKVFLMELDTKEMWDNFFSNCPSLLFSRKELLELAKDSRTFPRDKIVEIANSKD